MANARNYSAIFVTLSGLFVIRLRLFVNVMEQVWGLDKPFCGKFRKGWVS